jgi:hypothetical protein
MSTHLWDCPCNLCVEAFRREYLKVERGHELRPDLSRRTKETPFVSQISKGHLNFYVVIKFDGQFYTFSVLRYGTNFVWTSPVTYLDLKSARASARRKWNWFVRTANY